MMKIKNDQSFLECQAVSTERFFGRFARFAQPSRAGKTFQLIELTAANWTGKTKTELTTSCLNSLCKQKTSHEDLELFCRRLIHIDDIVLLSALIVILSLPEATFWLLFVNVFFPI